MSSFNFNNTPRAMKNKMMSDSNVIENSINIWIDKPVIKDDIPASIGALFSKLFDGFKACKLVCSIYDAVNAEILARANLETLFYMASIIKDSENYYKYIRSRDSINKLINVTINEKNLFSNDTRIEVKKIQEKYKSLNPSKPNDYKAVRAATDAGLKNAYNIAYRFHSPAVHSEALYIFTHYLEVDFENTKILGINIGPIDRDVIHVLWLNLVVVIEGCIRYFEYFNIGDIPTEIQQYRDYYYMPDNIRQFEEKENKKGNSENKAD